jgi:hypothetical protein
MHIQNMMNLTFIDEYDQQDGAPYHTGVETKEWLESNCEVSFSGP